jgi:superfamily I DNA/RNA helicase
MNHSIKDFGLPDLMHHHEFSSKIKILDFDSEESERNFILKKISEIESPLNEIFILARTNRQLFEFSNLLNENSIPHIVKTENKNTNLEISEGKITLATIHAIKGLESQTVFLIGANELNFPCKATDHPVIDAIKDISYDREEEERRLFYVAISRAKKYLYITYSGKKPTYFINDEMIRISRQT